MIITTLLRLFRLLLKARREAVTVSPEIQTVIDDFLRGRK